MQFRTKARVPVRIGLMWRDFCVQHSTVETMIPLDAGGGTISPDDEQRPRAVRRRPALHLTQNSITSIFESRSAIACLNTDDATI
jgi:hypothetical protein